jgi:hypothetical protein
MMVSIRYKEWHETADLSDHSVKEAREALREDLSIPDSARVKINGKVIKRRWEPDVILNDKDELIFFKASHRVLFLATALFIAIAGTGSAFAYGFISDSVAISVTMNEEGGNFADVSENNTVPISWTPSGSSSGATGNGTLWDIDSRTSNYTGDLTATVYLTNIDKMTHVYRGIGLFLAVYDAAGNVIDLNGDTVSDINSDVGFLSLKNGVIDLNIPGGADIYTVVLDNGFYITQVYNADTWTSDAIAPDLFIEITQR